MDHLEEASGLTWSALVTAAIRGLNLRMKTPLYSFILFQMNKGKYQTKCPYPVYLFFTHSLYVCFSPQC